MHTPLSGRVGVSIAAGDDVVFVFGLPRPLERLATDEIVGVTGTTTEDEDIVAEEEAAPPRPGLKDTFVLVGEGTLTGFWVVEDGVGSGVLTGSTMVG